MTTTTWKHSEVFPIIARIIEQEHREHQRYITAHEIAAKLFSDPEARTIIQHAQSQQAEKQPLDWLANNMVSWFSQRMSVSKSRWQQAFQRTKIDGRYAYIPTEATPTKTIPLPDIEAEEISAREGAISTRQHLHRERDRAIVAAKRRQVLAATGRLACSVCDFDFRQFYGELGAEYCEVHHLLSLADADGEVQTRLKDLAVVCSNCHRMLHHSHPFLTLEHLKSKIRDA